MRLILMVLLFTMALFQFSCSSDEDTTQTEPKPTSEILTPETTESKPTTQEVPAESTPTVTPAMSTINQEAYRCDFSVKKAYAVSLKMIRDNRPIKAFVLLNYLSTHYPNDDYGSKSTALLAQMKVSKIVAVQTTCPTCNGTRVYAVRCKSCGGSKTQPCMNTTQKYIDTQKEELHCQGGTLYNKKNIMMREKNKSRMLCKTCQGTGQVKCEKCNGSGNVNEPCQPCNNSGKVMEQAEQAITASEVYHHPDVIFQDLNQEKWMQDYLASHIMPSDEEKILMFAAENYLLTMAKKWLEEKKYPDAITLYSCCGEVCGKDISSQIKELQQEGIAYYFAQGDAYIQQQKFQESYECYEKARVLDKADQVVSQKIKETQAQEFQYYIQMGDQCVSAKKFPEAYQWYRKVIALNKDEKVALQKLEDIKVPQFKYCMQMADENIQSKNYIDAYQWCQQAMRLGQDNKIVVEKAREVKVQELQTGYFTFLRQADYTCQGITHNVREYRHQITGLEFVLVPGGTFQMGSNQGHENEKPVHEVTVLPFLMSKTEVTQGVWNKMMGENPSYFKQGNEYPVENVSWEDCQRFCVKVGLQLPTEEQWEFAARSGIQSEYCFGDSESELDNYAWYNNNSNNSTHAVAQKKPNGYGLYDVAGNVYEWCQDQYMPYKNMTMIDLQRIHQRIYRGGSWRCQPKDMRSAKRNGEPSGKGYNNLGFRVCS